MDYWSAFEEMKYGMLIIYLLFLGTHNETANDSNCHPWTNV